MQRQREREREREEGVRKSAPEGGENKGKKERDIEANREIEGGENKGKKERDIEANRERWSEGVINTNKSEREMVCVEESVIYIREREREREREIGQKCSKGRNEGEREGTTNEDYIR